MIKRIIHLDLDAFYCAVEEQLDPSLKGKPFAVGGNPQGRGVVSSCSYAARYYGVRSAMPTARAVQLCPDIILLPGNRKEYSKKSKEVMAILVEFSENIEQISIDEAFLDFHGNENEDVVFAKQIQDKVLDNTGLPCSLGIASNKLVAKIATDVGKNTNKTMDYPMAIQNVLPGNEASFLAPLPTKMLWGIGKQTAKILDDLGIHTIGDLANWPESDLIQRFGQHGKGLHRRALGIDQREIRPHSDTKSFSQEVTFRKDINDEKIIREQITRQSGSIAMSLHAGGLFGKVVKIKIRWPNFTTISKQVTLPTPTDDDKVIAEAAMKLLDHNWKHNHPIRLIGVSVSGLCPPIKQLSLWDQVREKGKKRPDGLEAAIQKVKMRFGESSIYFGNEQKGSKLREK